MITEMIGTEVGNFEIEISQRTKTYFANVAVYDIKIKSPSGYIHKETNGGNDPLNAALHWISDVGIDKEQQFLEEFSDWRIFEWGREDDLPIAESVYTMKDFA